MRLKSFRIRNYKSIIDSGECRLSDIDNLTILAGQNESWKSSILQALRDFEKWKINTEAYREDGSLPEITCTFSIEKDYFVPWNDILEWIKLPTAYAELLEILTEVTFIRKFDSKWISVLSFDPSLEMYFSEPLEFENKDITESNLTAKTEEEKQPLYEVETTVAKISNTLIEYTPKIIFFDDFCDLLPDQILLKDLKDKNTKAPGYQAARNIETIMGANFITLDTLSDWQKETTQTNYHEVCTAQFNEKWKQRIAEWDWAKIHIKHYQWKAEEASYLKFFIETKKWEWLTPGKRSQGFKWFLSFFLHLKAEDKRSGDLIILFDEPGLYLHAKAQSDMLAVFEELAVGNQILYSTHSPYLIDTKRLDRLRLVINSKSHQTTIEKITTIKIKNQTDALKPIIDAIGLEVASPFSVWSKNNVILEGISDFHYMNSMVKILNKNYNDLSFLPSMGASNVHLLMELCIWWWLNWLIVFDQKGTTKEYGKIKKNFFNDEEDEASKRIFKIGNCDGIEDIFTPWDMKMVIPETTFSSEKKNSVVVEEFWGKELYSRLFYEKVINWDITNVNLSKSALKKFEEIFKFIENGFGISD